MRLKGLSVQKQVLGRAFPKLCFKEKGKDFLPLWGRGDDGIQSSSISYLGNLGELIIHQHFLDKRCCWIEFHRPPPSPKGQGKRLLPSKPIPHERDSNKTTQSFREVLSVVGKNHRERWSRLGSGKWLCPPPNGRGSGVGPSPSRESKTNTMLSRVWSFGYCIMASLTLTIELRLACGRKCSTLGLTIFS